MVEPHCPIKSSLHVMLSWQPLHVLDTFQSIPGLISQAEGTRRREDWMDAKTKSNRFELAWHIMEAASLIPSLTSHITYETHAY